MGLLAPAHTSYGLILGSHLTTRPVAGFGTTVTAGGSANTMGSYAQLISGANLTADVYGIRIMASNAFVGGANRQTLFTIGLDPAGGTSYTDTLTELIADCPGSYIAGRGVEYFFPFFIKAGTSVGAKMQCTQASQTMSVAAWFYCKPRTPEAMHVGTKFRSYGVVTATSEGTVLTPGTTSEGSWTSMGTIADNDMWWFQVGYTASDATYGNTLEHVDLGIGDASNKHLVIVDDRWNKTTGEDVGRLFNGMGYHPAKNGDICYVRAQSSGTADTDTTAAVYAVGG